MMVPGPPHLDLPVEVAMQSLVEVVVEVMTLAARRQIQARARRQIQARARRPIQTTPYTLVTDEMLTFSFE